jgi:hypothetical protein
VAISVAAVLLICVPSSASAASTGSKGLRYETQMRRVGPSLGKALRAVATVRSLASHYPAKPTAARSAATALEPLPDLLRLVRAHLRTIRPPAGARSAHGELVRGAGDLAKELPPIILRLQHGYLTAGKRLATLAGVNELRQGVVALGKHGYRIGVGRL